MDKENFEENDEMELAGEIRKALLLFLQYLSKAKFMS